MAEWQISKSTKKCSGCQKTFEANASFYSALVCETINQKEQLSRQDYCPACWNPESKNFFSFWQTHLIIKNKPKTAKEVLIDFFDNLFASNNQEQTDQVSIKPDMKPKVTYLFALILLRKKILKLKSELNKNDQEYLVLERSSDNKTYEVPNLNITPDELIPLKNEFERLFEFEI